MSQDQIDLYRQVHEQNPKYGLGPGEPICGQIRDALKGVSVRSAMDYGCGRSRALYKLFPEDGVEKFFFDPAMPGKDEMPVYPVDVTICTDVMEHIPIEEVSDVLIRIRRKTVVRAFFVIHCGKASCILPDGQNAHCTICPPGWWRHTLGLFFRAVRPFSPGGRKNSPLFGAEVWPQKPV